MTAIPATIETETLRIVFSDVDWAQPRGTAWHSPAEEFEGHEVVVFFEAAAGAHGQASLRIRNRF